MRLLSVSALSALCILVFSVCAAAQDWGYGPVVVGPRALSDDELRTTEIAVPGEMTTAFLTLRLYLGSARYANVSPRFSTRFGPDARRRGC